MSRTSRRARRLGRAAPNPVEAQAQARPALLSRIPWVAIAISAIVLLAAAFSTSPLRDAATGEMVPEVRLAFSTAYIILGPLYDIMDTLTLLTIRQHIAVVLTVLVIYAAWRMLRRSGTPVRTGRVRREATRGVMFFAGILAFYALAALAPRPMAQLVLLEPDLVSVDFHAHTQFSHDGRRGWTAEDVRDWHQDAGFTAAYIADHRKYEGARRGLAGNPPTAADGTLILPALEVVWRGEHVNILGAGERYRGLTDPALRDIDEEALSIASLLVNNEPVLIQTFPGKVDQVIGAAGPGAPGVRAIEVVDGAPRGLYQTRAERAAIVHLADSLNLALVAGSDNHGWGRTAPGWTLMRINGWRGVSADSLATGIETIIRIGGRAGTRVVERIVPAAVDSPLRLVLTVPLVFWHMFTTLTADQRLMWIVWTWLLVVIVRGSHIIKRRARQA